ncbi:MAG: serine/threonine-protein kinase [Coriobacteriales bacterium]|nr:serine/threonine-protein kinase [Coriobacteriales bacterium]
MGRPSFSESLDAVLAAYDNDKYPPGFAGEYDIMECLGEGRGVDTFLVTNKQGERFVAKCYDLSVWDIDDKDDVLEGLDHPSLPRRVASYKDKNMLVVVRTYLEGEPIDVHVRHNSLDEQGIATLCVSLCDVLAYLHHRAEPIIHRDIKPQNVLVQPNGSVALIDFDIARTYHVGNETDTRFFGTIAYAPPEQYGFAQTDVRADIYALGVLLRCLLTGSPRQNHNVRVYAPLQRIINKCTAFDPNKRYTDIDQVRAALLAANPRRRALRIAGVATASILAFALVVLGCVKAYEAATWSPFGSGAAPAVVNDEQRIAEAVQYMKETYNTDLFGSPDDLATVGFLRQVLIDCYGLDHDYVYNHQEEGLPVESDEYFMPWGWEDNQNVRRDTAVYAAVKVHDPSLVAEDQWSKLTDDNGEYPGSRVAVLYAQETGIVEGANRPFDVTKGEVALIFANADRVFTDS